MRVSLTREETAAMKGFAICVIVLHNLLHMIAPLIKENEFTYLYYKAYYMREHLTGLHPNLMGDLFSFFGWYGVPVFLFLSGYGLVMKYENPALPAEEGSWRRFLIYNYRKLWMLMTPAYLAFLLICRLRGEFHFEWGNVLAQLTMTSNLICRPDEFNPGSYWYFGVTLQLYIIYRLFFYRRSLLWRSVWFYVLLAFPLFWIASLMVPSNVRSQPEFEMARHNAVGWLLPFLLGICWAWEARKQQDAGCSSSSGETPAYRRYGGWLLLLAVSGVLLWYSCFQQKFWLFSPVFAVCISLAFVKLVSGCGWLLRLGCWLGGLSAFMFAVHPLVRPFFREWIGKNGQPYVESLCYLLACWLAAWGYRELHRRWLAPFCERIINRIQFGRGFGKKA